MSTLRTVSRWALAALLIAAGVGHLTTLRRGFRIVVPDWTTRLLRTDKDTIVVVSGVVEIALGAALVALPKERSRVGAAVAAFFVAVFPGNVALRTLGGGGGVEAAGDEEHAESVVVVVAEAAGDAAGEFDEAVHGLGAAVG